MDRSSLDATTMRPVASPQESEPSPQVFALTILAHADPKRIGEIALVPDLDRGAIVRISRLEPEFAPTGQSQGEPLCDPNISRRPIALSALGNGDVQVTLPERGTPVHIAGKSLDKSASGEHTIAARDIDHGVVLVLAERAALMLHRRRAPVAGDSLGLVGASEALDELRGAIRSVAELRVPVLLAGESGTGKELTARAIHNAGAAGGELVAVNIATLPPQMAASQLFGHKKGAFTGAESDVGGLFRSAHGGTLFLDEIGEASAEIQVMLLRALEEGAVRPLGSDQPVPVETRVIAATDTDLERAVTAGEFRTALYHRLNGYRIALPPLRDRRDDVARLLVHFLRLELAAAGDERGLELGPPEQAPRLPADLVARLVAYDWPGNVRELHNVARRLVVVSRQQPTLQPDSWIRDLLERSDERADERLGEQSGEPVRPASSPAQQARRRPAEIDDGQLIAALEANNWRPAATATALGISKTSLYAIMGRSKSVRKARELTGAEIEQALSNANGDAGGAARALRVSRRGLRLRMTELGM